MSHWTAGLNQLGPSPSAAKHAKQGHIIGRTAARYVAATRRGIAKAHLFGKASRRKPPAVSLAPINLPPDNG